MRALITILDNTTETSMPFNEFVLYRANHYFDEKQILIICGPKGDLPKVEIPERLIIKYAGRNLINIRRVISRTIVELRARDIPYVIHMHQVQSGFLAEMAMLGTGFRRKALFTVHSTFSGYKLHNKFLSFVNTLFAQQITCVSNASFWDYPKIIRRIKGQRIRALQNGVDTERIDSILNVMKPVAHEFVRFIYVARLIPLKNHGFLVDVLKECSPCVHFVFVGMEDKKGSIREKAEKLGISDRITFTGLISRNEVFQQLQDADYYISSSTLEGLPVSVLEAMYCGLPCVLSDIPQHREIAGEGVSILPFDVQRWAEQINRLAGWSNAQKTVMSSRIKEKVLQRFTLKSMHEKYDEIYEQL